MNRFVGILCIIVSVVAIAAGGCAAEERAQSPTEILGNTGPGPQQRYTLDNVVDFADVIARVELLSVDSEAELLNNLGGGTVYGKSLHHRFRVLEYLKGGGGQEMVLILPSGTQNDTQWHFSTAEEAEELGPDLMELRSSEWDDREAIVFVQHDSYWVPSTQKDDTHLVGLYSTALGWVGTIDSEILRRWLPIARAGDTGNIIGDILRNREGDDRLFLTEIPREPNRYGLGPYRDPSSTQTPGQISVRELKEKIKASQQRAERADGSTARANSPEIAACLEWASRWEDQIEKTKLQLGGDYYYQRDDSEISSGTPARSVAFESPHAYFVVEALNDPTRTDSGEYRVTGRDAKYFAHETPGIVYTLRPLPDRSPSYADFRVHFSYRDDRYIPCDAHPEEEMERQELFVTVAAPASTLHEAFFDPVALSGGGVGATGSSGVIDPDEFTVGSDDVEIDGLEWRSGSVVLELDDYVSLSGQALDFIELDGSIDTSLDIADATVNQTAATWTWSVASQPWDDGDLLMLRIRETDTASE